MNISDMMNCAADGVYQRGASAGRIILIRHRSDLLYIHPVVQYIALTVEKYDGDQGFARFLFLFLNHGIEAADGISLQSAHGTAAVKDKYDFR